MDGAPTLPTSAGWLPAAGKRTITYPVSKFLGTSAVMTGFFISYFWLLNHPRSAPTTVPIIFLDHWIPFSPGALPLYISLWFYVIIPPALLLSPAEMKSYSVTTILLSCAGFAVFYFWPTAVPPALVDPAAMPTLAHLKIVDATGNAFPSLHVAFAVFTALWIARQLREVRAPAWARALNWLWCAGIVYSTVAIRQHVALDAISGAALGAPFAWVQQALLNRLEPK